MNKNIIIILLISITTTMSAQKIANEIDSVSYSLGKYWRKYKSSISRYRSQQL